MPHRFDGSVWHFWLVSRAHVGDCEEVAHQSMGEDGHEGSACVDDESAVPCLPGEGCGVDIWKADLGGVSTLS